MITLFGRDQANRGHRARVLVGLEPIERAESPPLRLRLADLSVVPCAGLDPTTRHAVVAIDVEAWTSANGTAWTAALHAHTQLRIAGWRLVRFPYTGRAEPSDVEILRRVGALS